MRPIAAASAVSPIAAETSAAATSSPTRGSISWRAAMRQYAGPRARSSSFGPSRSSRAAASAEARPRRRIGAELEQQPARGRGREPLGAASSVIERSSSTPGFGHGAMRVTLVEPVTRRDALLLLAALSDLGIVVPVHQARRRGARAVGGRAWTARLRRASARCAPARAGRSPARSAATSSRSSSSARSTTPSPSGCSASPRRASTPA